MGHAKHSKSFTGHIFCNGANLVSFLIGIRQQWKDNLCSSFHEHFNNTSPGIPVNNCHPLLSRIEWKLGLLLHISTFEQHGLSHIKSQCQHMKSNLRRLSNSGPFF